MFNNFKATVRKLTDLPWEDFKNLFTWPSNSTIQADNPNLLVAKATNPRGEVVAYVTAEPILLVNGYVFNPKSTSDDSRLAGDAVDIELAKQAGATKIWIVVPSDVTETIKGEKFIRVVARKVFQPVATTHLLADYELKQPIFIN